MMYVLNRASARLQQADVTILSNSAAADMRSVSLGISLVDVGCAGLQGILSGARAVHLQPATS